MILKRALLTAVSDARGAYKELINIQDEFISQTIDAVNKIDNRYNNLYNKSSNMISKLKDLYGPNSFKQVNDIYDTQAKIIDSQLTNLQAAHNQLMAYRDTLDKNTDSWKQANDAVNELGDKIENLALNKMELLKNQFNDFTESIFNGFEKMFGNWGFSSAIEDFDELIAKQDKYLSSFEKLTTINTKIKSINDEIAKTNDPKRAAELAKYRDQELAVLLQQDKVSKDDYERAQRLYEIKLKELALQERQDAKRMAQLVRDSNGNMTYEYVRQETVDTSKELEELQEQKDDLYKFDSGKVKESAKGVFDVIQSYQSKLKELQDKGLSPEEYQKELDKMLEEATDKIQEKTTEMNKWITNAGKDGMSSMQNMLSSGAITPDMFGTDKNTMDSIFQSMNDGSLTIQDLMSGNYDDFAESLGTTSEELQSTIDKMLEVILGDNLEIAKAMMEASDKWTSTARENVDNLGQAYNQYITNADQVLQKYKGSTDQLNNSLTQTNAAAKAVIDTTKNQIAVMEQSKAKTDSLSQSTKNLENMLIGTNGKSGLYGAQVQLQMTMNNKLQPAYVETQKQTDVLRTKTYDAALRYKQLNNEATDAKNVIIDYNSQRVREAMGRIDEIKSKTSNTAGAFATTAANARDAKAAIGDFSTAISKLQGYGALQVSSPGKAVGMASGGYTGTWTNSTNNSEGRLAVLHEKELVLNSTDTQNILEAVNIQRKLAKQMEGRNSGLQKTINNSISNINNTTNNSEMSTKEILQPVTIHANFPSVSSEAEIKGAFRGLTAKASTYISKR